MIKTIGITFNMSITQNGDTEKINFNTEAKLLKKQNRHYLKFKEPIVDGLGYNDTLFIISEDTLTIERTGQVKMSQQYKKQHHCEGTYKNKYISTPLTTYTNDYQFSTSGIYLNYDMIVNNERVGNYELEVNFKGDDQI